MIIFKLKFYILEPTDSMRATDPEIDNTTDSSLHNSDGVKETTKSTEDDHKDKIDHNSEQDDDATPPVSPSVDTEEQLNFGQVVIPKAAQNALQTLMSSSEKDMLNSNHTSEDARLFLASEDSVHCK